MYVPGHDNNGKQDTHVIRAIPSVNDDIHNQIQMYTYMYSASIHQFEICKIYIYVKNNRN